MLRACTCKTPDSDRRSYCKESKSYWSPVRVVIILLTICGGLWRIPFDHARPHMVQVIVYTMA